MSADNGKRSPCTEEFNSLDDPAAYHEYVREKASSSNQKRFESITERSTNTVLTIDTLKVLCRGKYQATWKGVDNMKCCTDLTIYKELLWEVKPRTVIEIGAFMGGSALWIGDMLSIFQCQSHVYSMDIDLSLLHPTAVKCQPNVTFLQGDSMKIEETFTPDMLKTLPHPWVITEDAHINVAGVLEHFHQFLLPGDYLIIEDTNPLIPIKFGMGFSKEYDAVGSSIHMNEMTKFLEKYVSDYAIDTKFTDMFGYNGCWNMNGYIKKLF